VFFLLTGTRIAGLLPGYPRKSLYCTSITAGSRASWITALYSVPSASGRCCLRKRLQNVANFNSQNRCPFKLNSSLLTISLGPYLGERAKIYIIYYIYLLNSLHLYDFIRWSGRKGTDTTRSNNTIWSNYKNNSEQQ